MLSWVSDWPIWGWYLYPIRPALLLAVFVLFRSFHPVPLLRSRWVAAGLTAIALVRLYGLHWQQFHPDIVDAAVDLSRFAAGHPGTYAMGDRIGAVGYLLHRSLVQTEGLMMDRAYLDVIARQGSLRTALKSYRARYYIASTTAADTHCLKVSEPMQAGSHAPHLTDVFCEPPVAQWQHGDVRTMVFSLDR